MNKWMLRASVTDVNVWVKVVDSSGRPVMGMRKDEFEIFEDGKKMNSECFEEIAIASIDDADKSVEKSTGTAIASQSIARRFVLFLDYLIQLMWNLSGFVQKWMNFWIKFRN
jgi:hypothetical protein